MGDRVLVANVATTSNVKIKTFYGERDRYFSLESLKGLVKSSPGKPITVGFNYLSIGEVIDAWIEDDCMAFISFKLYDGTIQKYNKSFMVPGFRISGEKRYSGPLPFQTVVCKDYALTNKPLDKNLYDIKYMNKYFYYTDSKWFFWDEVWADLIGPYKTYMEANQQLNLYFKQLNQTVERRIECQSGTKL